MKENISKARGDFIPEINPTVFRESLRSEQGLNAGRQEQVPQLPKRRRAALVKAMRKRRDNHLVGTFSQVI